MTQFNVLIIILLSLLLLSPRRQLLLLLVVLPIRIVLLNEWFIIAVVNLLNDYLSSIGFN